MIRATAPSTARALPARTPAMETLKLRRRAPVENVGLSFFATTTSFTTLVIIIDRGYYRSVSPLEKRDR